MIKYTTILAFIFSSMNYSMCQNPINELYAGESDGHHSETFLNGTIRCTYTIQNGNLTGNRISYYKNGELWCVEQFQDGNFNGTNYLLNKNLDTVYIEKYKSDTLLYTKNYKYYKNDSLQEIKTIWYTNDTTLEKNPFKTSKAIGGMRISLIETETNKNNHGIVYTFYKSGGLMSIREINNGLFTGKYLEYYQSGELKIDASQINGAFDGSYIQYSPQGEIIDECTYTNGKRIK